MTISPAHPVAHNGHGRGYSVADMRDLILAMSDERAVWAERERTAYRRGLAEGTDRGRTEGWLGCMATVKRTDAEMLAAFRKLPRKTDPRPRRGDWPGGERGLARVRASWAAWEAAQDWGQS